MLVHRDVDPRLRVDPGAVEADLPGVGHREDGVRADQLGPVEPVAVRGGQQPGPVAALLVDPVGPLERGDARPVGGVGVQGDVVLLDEDLHPVVEPADHQRADRAEPAGVDPGGLGAPEAALHGLGRGDALGDREHDGDVGDDAARGRVLHRLEARGRARELDLDVGGQGAEVDGLVGHPLRVPVVGGVRLEREATLLPVVGVEDRLQDPRAAGAHLLDQRPGRARPRTRWGSAAIISRTRGTQWSFSFFITSSTITGFEVAPVPPRSTAYASSATAQESFQKSVGVDVDHPQERAVDRRDGQSWILRQGLLSGSGGRRSCRTG